MESTSLFDCPSIWDTEPMEAFASFVQSAQFLRMSKRRPKAEPEEQREPAPLRTSSAKTYLAMFGKFTRWLMQRQARLSQLTSEDLLAFLDQKNEQGSLALNSAIRMQYLGLFERVYRHLDVEPNPARIAIFALQRSEMRAKQGSNQAKVVLTAEQCAAFMQALPSVHAQAASPVGWKRRRDRAMQALMLGAGLKVSEVIGLYLENIGEPDASGCLPINVSPASVGGTVREHSTRLRPFAVPEVLTWLGERKRLALPGQLVFPASLQGGRIARATVYRQVRATFERARIPAGHPGGRTLRNAFAVQELAASGNDTVRVQEYLGHRKARSIEPYKQAADMLNVAEGARQDSAK